MKAFSADRLTLPLPAGHRFPAEKYVRLRQRIESSPEFADVELCFPEAASEAQLRLVHTPEYVAAVLSGTLTERQMRRIGLPWSPELAERSRRSVGGTLAASEAPINAPSVETNPWSPSPCNQLLTMPLLPVIVLGSIRFTVRSGIHIQCAAGKEASHPDQGNG